MVFQLFKTAKPPMAETKASAVAPVVSFHGSGRPAWSGRDNVSLTKNGFLGNPIGFRCIKMIAEAIAAIPLSLHGEEGRYDVHPILSLLQSPNPSQRRSELIETLVGQMLVTGDGYIEGAALDGDELPRELYVLRSDRMRVIPGSDGWPVAYEYKVGGKKHRFDMQGEIKPILHLKSFHPLDDHYGLSPLHAAATAIDVHSSACKWSKALLDNAARPSGAIIYKGGEGQATLGSEQYNRLVDEIELNHTGARNAGRPMLLEGGLDWKQMGFSPSDMEFQKTKDSAAREIALALGVPPMLLGLPGDNTFANYQEANRAFYRQTILPLVIKIGDGIANWLSENQKYQIRLRPDIDAIPALAIERDMYWNRIAQADFLSDAEKRKMLGLSDHLGEV